MSLWPYIVLFVAGALLGLIIHPLARMIDLEGINRLLAAVARMAAAPFVAIGRALRGKGDRKKEREEEPKKPDAPVVDANEQRISDTAQAIRSILRSIAVVIQRTDQAADDSTQALGDVRNAIGHMSLPGDLLEVHGQLMSEIDRVLSSNAALRNELSSSREILATQREQIESLKSAVRIDGLTQLANRTSFDEKLAEMVQIRQRYEEPFSLMMIDVDRFKEINDTYGHQGGDRVLKGVAFKIRSVLRVSDFVARFGGDEFAVILIKSGARTAAEVAEKLCGQIRGGNFLLDGVQVRATLSIGVAEAYPGEEAEDVMKRADAALYRVKEMGRNGVQVAPPPEG